MSLGDCPKCWDAPPPPAVWTGLMAGFAPAPTDRTTTNSGDVGGPIAEHP
jgi:hypothetical protein